METGSLKSSLREPKGSKAAARARRAGSLPAVLYGGGAEVLHLAVPAEPFRIALRHHRRVFDLEVGGKPVKAFLKSVQHDALGDEVLHVDFLRIDETKRMRVSVPLEFAGHPKGLTHGGEFVHPRNEIEVECLPTEIPESIRLTVDHLDVGMSVLARELTLPAGVSLVTLAESLVCTVRLKGVEPEPVAEGVEPGPAEPEMIVKRPAAEAEPEEPKKEERKEKEKEPKK
jgi:large subunit ribosomal protein L25